MSNASFLPEDYVAQAAERRTNIASLVLFGVVMTAVFGAFLVTNRQWTQVRKDQIRINSDTERAATEIRKMQDLEEKRGQMVEKAELAMALVEPVPRSVLLALVVNAMPQRLSLIDFDLRTEEIKKPKKVADKDKAADPKAKSAAQATKVESRGKTKAEAAVGGKDGKDAAKSEPTRFLTVIAMTGVAPSDLEVSRYMNALADVTIFKGVRLETTEEKEVDSILMRQFKISFRIDPEADVRALKHNLDRPTDPMSTRMRMTPPALQSSVSDHDPLDGVTADPTLSPVSGPESHP
ncbi:MAG: PilN domain-containing protein [Phycisphaerae bacterium]|nr:PilN domain-containing protein [Phycisphaerae bacterium]